MTVSGPVDPATLDLVLAAETLLCAPPRRPGNAGLPATEAAFERALVTMGSLGKLLMGAPNRDDETLDPIDAEVALDALAALCVTRSAAASPAIAVTALAGLGSQATPDQLGALSAASGVSIVRGTNGRGRAVRRDPDLGSRLAPEEFAAAISAELACADHPAGIVGFVDLPRDAAAAAAVEAAAHAARTHGAALVLAPAERLGELHAGLAAVDRAGLDRSRVIVTGAAALIGARQSNGHPGAGVDAARVSKLEDLGTAICFDDLGRIPNTSTVVSDHDVAVSILGLVEQGAGARVIVSSGIRNKHRLASHGGNGLHFLPQQFVPYLRMLGANEETLRAIAGGNAARIIARHPAAVEEPAR